MAIQRYECEQAYMVPSDTGYYVHHADHEAVLAQRTDGVTPIPFHDWWASQGKFIDPDTEDVPWYDKREALCEAAYAAGQSSARFAEAYVSQRTDGATEQEVRKAMRLTIPRP